MNDALKYAVVTQMLVFQISILATDQSKPGMGKWSWVFKSAGTASTIGLLKHWNYLPF
jgi:hypothetical protein